MNVFELDRVLVNDYERFSRSFTRIRADDIRRCVDEIYASGRFWPEPLISINPHFERGAGIADLVKDGTLHPETGKVFRVAGVPITLHRHQEQAVSKAISRKSFVVTTGTGSGKSLCFFVPIIDAAIRARAAGEPQRTRAIIVYPMNALANSQIKELEKFVEQSGLDARLRPTFARYTGQESAEERELISRAKPDILLTNFMMLELLMTRQNTLDQTVIMNARALDFIVLDELHTYRGRQGADVAMLVRRVRDRLCPDKEPVCIGTSATMASEGSETKRAEVVAAVATRLFGTSVSPDAVIDETLERATDQSIKTDALKALLAVVVNKGIVGDLDDTALWKHPLAVWIELEIGLLDKQTLSRRPPTTISGAARKLAEFTGCAEKTCRTQIEAMLTLMSRSEKDRGGSGDRAFLAFKLHRFFSGAGGVYATLRTDDRRVTLDGQRFDPEDKEARLYPTFFCRGCGQEFHSVTLADDEGVRRALPRSIDDTPVDDSDSEDEAGYFMPIPEGDADFSFSGAPEDFPEDWTELGPRGLQLRKGRRKWVPNPLTVQVDGQLGESGKHGLFISGKFRFCPACGHQPSSRARERNKLASLSAEGRSSATTLLVSSTLRWMNKRENSVPQDKRKLLGFTDNRQDAALQAGNFNDFLFVTLLRAGLLAAVRAAGNEGLGEDEFGRRIQAKLGFVASKDDRRQEWMIAPETKGIHRQDAERVLSRVVTYRVWADQKRGWRFTNPNLEELGLISAEYAALGELAADDEAFESAPAELRNLPPERRRQALRILFEALRQGLAISAETLELQALETTMRSAGQFLREPWTISDRENLRSAAALIVVAPSKNDTNLRSESLIIRGGPRSRLAKELNRSSIWGERLSGTRYLEVLEALLRAAAEYQLVQPIQTVFDVEGWQLAASAVRLVAGSPALQEKQPNPYFLELYNHLAAALGAGGEGLFGLESREHTAQVDQERREWREWRFRFGADDRARIAEHREEMRIAQEPDQFLPTLFCSPTMELGVDISALNTVYLRNVPPTPANYAQRSGRAGRSGQAALVVTYCAAQSPHDQYYFSRRDQMVGGIVRPPALDLANRDLVEAHLHAVWIAEAGQELSPDIPHVLDLTKPGLPVAQTIAENLGSDALAKRAADPMRRVLDSIDFELTASGASWASEREEFLASVVANASRQFSEAFGRWRQLYEGARTQLIEANRKSEMHGLEKQERRDAKIAQAQANEQLALLERGRATGGSDFYTYRYLATEGFLPGYNFPRLPLYAYVPAVGAGGPKAAYLQRARFLAIAEFGPRSLIYHEGRAYRVYKAKLSPDMRGTEDGKLTTTKIYICDRCGAAHDEERDRCHACGAQMAGIHPIRNTLRIDNVETTPAERITANDEDRQRQGFEIQTVFSWPLRDGQIDVTSATLQDQDGPIANIHYAHGALISRINKGLRRRKEKSILGFGIDAATGRWTKTPDDDSDEVETPDGPVTQRVVPIVQDNKNAALFRPSDEDLSETAITTVQHALTRGIEIAFQLEEGEVLTEPVPGRENRRAILAFEATEGGAGVLGRIVGEPAAIRTVARTALQLMHFDKVDEAIASRDAEMLVDVPDANCVKGCYRCLLSYYNQPDQELIDRTDKDAKRMLLRLACSEVAPVRRPPDAVNGTWASAFKEGGILSPDARPLKIGSQTLPFVWRTHLVAASDSSVGHEDLAEIEAQGFALVELPHTPSASVLAKLRSLLGVDD
ncbi:DEAD/DEAH box helicase [Mesorhizobium opportunistum]|uniref:DEAD/DEAH box helicase n=1 Tax=Mesorhizobium opportunistum TaxID=593909 RepID=A0ABV1YBI5_9HYPH